MFVGAIVQNSLKKISGLLILVVSLQLTNLHQTNAMETLLDGEGATNPEEADAGTIRKEFALSIGENSVHGSDSLENAEKEISFFFADTEIVG